MRREKDRKEGRRSLPSLRKRKGSFTFVPPRSYLCSRPNPNRINCEQTVLYERRKGGEGPFSVSLGLSLHIQLMEDKNGRQKKIVKAPKGRE